jgi:hypothetical protein
LQANLLQSIRERHNSLQVENFVWLIYTQINIFSRTSSFLPWPHTEIILKMAAPNGSANAEAQEVPNDGTGVVQLDPWLSPFKESLKRRYAKAQDWIKKIEISEGGVEKFSQGTEKFGLNVDKDNNIIYREWAPNATEAYLIGDFSEPCLRFVMEPG